MDVNVKVSVIPGMVRQLSGKALVDIVRILWSDVKAHNEQSRCKCERCVLFKDLIDLGVVELSGTL